MESNPLAGFRRRGEAPAPAEPAAEPTPAPADGLKPYEAFATKDKLERLQVRRVLGPTHAPSYNYLLDISYDREFGTNFVLVYSFGLMVQVRGKHLQKIVQAIILSTCQYIQDFHAEEHQLPADDAPMITLIEVIVKATPDAMRDAEHQVVPPR